MNSDTLELNGGSGGSSISGILNLLSQSSRRRGGSTRDSKELDREGANEVKVDDSAATVLGKTNVEEEDGLEEPVKWNPVKNGFAPELNDGEESVNNPISQKVGIISSRLSLKSLKRVVTRDDQRCKVGKELANSTKIEKDKEKVNEGETNNTVSLGNTSLGLKLLKSRETLQFLCFC